MNANATYHDMYTKYNGTRKDCASSVLIELLEIYLVSVHIVVTIRLKQRFFVLATRKANSTFNNKQKRKGAVCGNPSRACKPLTTNVPGVPALVTNVGKHGLSRAGR